VIGISITFMIVDLLGGVFSDLSLVFKTDFDAIAAVTYTLVVVSIILPTHFFSPSIDYRKLFVRHRFSMPLSSC
jgi:hypothetical protein